MVKKYSLDIELKMLSYYNQLGERDRRHYASMEAVKLGFGGKKYIYSLFKMSPRTLRKGVLEINDLPVVRSTGKVRQRKAGGGRKPFFCPNDNR